MNPVAEWRSLPTTRARIAAVVAVVGWLLGLIGLIGLSLVEDRFFGSPRVPTAASGQTVPYQIKGATVFVTEQDATEAHRFWITAICGGAIIVLVAVVEPGALRRRSN